MQSLTRAGTLSAAAILTLTLAACGSNDDGSMAGMDHSSSSSSAPSSSSSSPAVDAEHNAADISFAQGMVVHHRGALDMAEMAVAQASTAEVQDLARKIQAAQQPEIDQMNAMLTAWGEPTPADEGMEGMDHGSMDPDMGMMTQGQMDQLMSASGTEFDRMFLQMMTVHHQGAVDMAQTEQTNGSNSQAIDLARTIEADQTQEITEMSDLLAALPS